MAALSPASRAVVATAVAVALLGVACNRGPSSAAPAEDSAKNRDALLFPALFAAASDGEARRCEMVASEAEAPRWLREAVDGFGCTDTLLSTLAALDARPETDPLGFSAGELRNLLGAAALCNDVEGLRRLLRGGADVNGHDACGGTALVAAASTGATASVRRLLEAGADPNLTAGKGRWMRTPLLAALMRADIAAATALVAAGADPNAATSGGRTPLMFAATLSDVRLTLMLLERGADPCAKDEGGMDASVVARVHGSLLTTAALTERGEACGAGKVPDETDDENLESRRDKGAQKALRRNR